VRLSLKVVPLGSVPQSSLSPGEECSALASGVQNGRVRRELLARSTPCALWLQRSSWPRWLPHARRSNPIRPGTRCTCRIRSFRNRVAGRPCPARPRSRRRNSRVSRRNSNRRTAFPTISIPDAPSSSVFSKTPRSPLSTASTIEALALELRRSG
jgi:hypothetical protein